MIRRELTFFIFNGLVSVAIAYGSYHALVSNGWRIEAANAIAYLSGMGFGFIANNRLTFRCREEVSIRVLMHYASLHLATLLVNVAVNSIAIDILRGLPAHMTTAFIVAITFSTVLNFLGLKYWVFKQNVVVPVGPTNSRIIKL